MSAPGEDAAIVAGMVREHDFPRYAASLFAPEPQRRAMLALAAFALEIGRIPDQVSQPLPGEVRLQWWIDALQGTEHGGVGGHPVAAEVLHAIEAFAIDREALLAMAEAHKFDLYDDAMPNTAALEVYCDDTEGAWLGAAATMLSRATDVADAVRHAGRALGLARLIARLGHDAAHRRCFLPADGMAAHGVTRGDVLAGEETPSLKGARDELIATARREGAEAKRVLKSLPKAVRPAFLPLATLRYELRALETSPVFAVTPPASRLRVLASQGWMMRR